MSVYIPGMEMPTSCGLCPLRHEARDGDECYLGASLTEYQKRPDDCPLVPIPPHGDLIDRDAIKETFCGNCFADEKPMECPEPCMDMRIILDASTIIPADPAEEGE